MKRLAVALAPLILAASAFSAQAQDPHAGHNMPPPPRTPAATPAPGPHASHQTPAPTAAQDPHAGHVMPSARTPVAADPHAGHDMSIPAPAQPDPHAGHDMSTTTPGQTDPHAGHDMSTMGQTEAAPATRAGHDMSTMGQAQPAPAGASGHPGHDMSTMGQTEAAPAMPAGHDMSAMGQAQPAPAAASGHAGHDMSDMGQTPAPAMSAGHDMSGAAMPPDVPTSADNPGRPPEAPVPAGATSRPPHAADQLFDSAEMAAARSQLYVEHGNVRTTAVIIDRLEATFGDGEDGYGWDAQGWSGGDINRFWWKSDGKGTLDGDVEEAEIQALYSRAFRPFFDFQAGLRQTYRPQGDRIDLVVGVQGLAPYWFEVDAAAFLSNKGDLTARAQAEYDQRITNRWIVQPRAEVVLSAQDIPELSIGSGLSSLQIGARLRYELRKEFAPYVGVEWTRSFGKTADFLEADGRSSQDTRLFVGIRAWF
ncbi:MAG: copper resistance protein B [Brevundimonas sp.]|uniref:copper resistance protein B n=1 Tax=Brevundimonas sp. TaxID=1871086 RepID=UPI00248833FA|nr:copper resistance protein B [Brevundimonas sp.]MDI1326527.1 copper resistance protein B [Brevundimonas sp.]